MDPKVASSSGADGVAIPKRKSKRPKYSRFSQQELPAFKPILTPTWVITTFVTIAVLFIPIGLACLFASEHVVEIVDRYDLDCIPSDDKLAYIQDSATNKSCYRTLTVSPSFYNSTNANKRVALMVTVKLTSAVFRYVRSRSDVQLRLKGAENQTGEFCHPEEFTSNGSTIVPCGLIAWSLFNDTYKFSLNNNALEISKKDLIWKSDEDGKFGKDVYPKNFQSEGLIGGGKLNASIPLSEQVDLIIWMRTAALPKFRKLYGKIEVDLEPNTTLNVEIENNYNTYSFDGKKELVLSTASWLGGKNDFIGVAYLTFGSLSLSFALGFIILYLLKPRTLGDPSYLSWNRDTAGRPIL